MTKVALAIIRLQTPDPKSKAGDRTVRVDDLNTLIAEFRRVQSLVDSEFSGLEDGATRLIESEAVPVGFAVVSDNDGKVIFAGPLHEMPPVEETVIPTVLTINLNPATKAAIERTASIPRGPLS